MSEVLQVRGHREISYQKLRQFTIQHQEQGHCTTEHLMYWLEKETDYEFTIVEKGFVMDLLSLIKEYESIGDYFKIKWKPAIKKFTLEW